MPLPWREADQSVGEPWPDTGLSSTMAASCQSRMKESGALKSACGITCDRQTIRSPAPPSHPRTGRGLLWL